MRVLIIAGQSSSEMRPVAGILTKQLPESLVERVGDVRAAVHRIVAENRHPALLVVCQNWPDEYSRAEVNELFRVAPLARWICCYGSWCESDGRNWDIWPPGSRVPVRGFAARLTREIEILNGVRDPLPLTASRDEVFEFDAVERIEASRSRRVRVESRDRAWKESMEAFVQSAGHSVVQELNESTGIAADVVLRDLDPWNAAELELPSRRADRSAAPVFIGLMGLPHPEDVITAQSSGYQTVLSKLAPLDEIAAAILQ